MDRTFNFFDHQTVMRQSTAGNHGQSSPSLIPQSVFQAQQHQTSSFVQDRQYQLQEPHRNPHNQTHTHLQHALHHQYAQNRPIRHHFREQHSRPPPEPTRQHPNNLLPLQSQHQAASQQSPLSQHLQSQSQEHISTHQLHQQLQLHPIGPHLHDSVVSAAEGGVSLNASSQPVASNHRPCNQQQLNHHPHPVRQLQLEAHHQAQHHSPQFSLANQLPPTSSVPMPTMTLSQSPVQLGAPALTVGSSNGTFPATAALSHSTSHFAQTVSHENHQNQHPSQVQVQSQGNISNQTLGNAHNSSNTFTGQPLHVQPVLTSQQGSNTASFGSLGNMHNNVLPGGSVEDPSGSVNQFVSQSGDTISVLNPWESSQHQVSLVSQRITGQTQQQPLLPPPLVGDTRTMNSGRNGQQNQSYGAHPENGQSNLGGTFSGGPSARGPALNNNTVISGLAHMSRQVGQNVSASEKEVLRQPLTSPSLNEGPNLADKHVKKARAHMGRKPLLSKGSGSRTLQPMGGPITSPVSTATLPNLKRQVTVKRISTTQQSNPRKADHDLKLREYGCNSGINDEVSHLPGLTTTTAIASGNSLIHKTTITKTMDGVAANTHVSNERNPPGAARATNSIGEWPAKKSNVTKNRKCRRNLDGRPAATVPVHLRNPKKGRARVFRECQQCKSENHIRRSDCIACKAPLPAGKRRRDGNPSYSRKLSSASAAPCTRAQPRIDPSQETEKEDAAVSSVTGK
eukprot:GFKZ01013942.1.p1 GENE.GFKZ01013942.1~~GFKZ01013942.1.p1  ORF type:complete len:737 (-),score=47.97 GFKZ01013942.1:816-3026(-)